MADPKDLSGVEDSPDKETKEILDEIAAEEADNPDAEGSESDKDKEVDKSKEDDKPDEDKSKESSSDDSDDDADSDKEKDKESGKPDKEDSPPLKRDTRAFMPTSKHTSIKRELDSKIVQKDETIAERDAKIEELQSKLKNASSSNVEKRLDDYADKHGMDKEQVKELAELVGQLVEIPVDVQQRLSKMETESKDTQEEVTFQAELINLETEISANPDNYKGLKTLVDVKERIRELAYTPKYASTPLSLLYLGLPEFRDTPGKKTAESKQGPSSRSDIVHDEAHFDEIRDDAEAISKLPDDVFDKFMDYHSNKDKSRTQINRH